MSLTTFSLSGGLGAVATTSSVPDPGDTTAPIITSLANQSIAENAQFSMTLTANEQVTWSKSGGDDQSFFNLSGSMLSLLPQNYDDPVDSGMDNTFSVIIRATDLAGKFSEQLITVSITNVLENTLSALTMSNYSIAERSAPGVLVGNVIGLTSGSSWVLANTAGNRFAKIGNTVVTGTTATNYDTAQTHDIVLRETIGDATNSPRDTTLTISVTDIADQTLSALTLSSNSIPENSPPGTLVGSVLGLSSGSTWALTDTAGDRFAKSGDTIVTGSTPTDYESFQSHTITIREINSNAGNSPRDTSLTVTVSDVAEGGTATAPVLVNYNVASGTTAALSANKPVNTAAGNLLIFVTTQDIAATASTFTAPANDGTLITPQNSSFGGSGVQMEAWYKIAGASEPATYTLTRSQARIGTFWVIAISDPASGLNWKHMIAENFNNTGAATKPVMGALNPTLEPLFELVLVTWDEGKALTGGTAGVGGSVPAGFTNNWQDLASHDALMSYRTDTNGAALPALNIDISSGTKWAGFRLLAVSPSAVADTSGS